MGKHDYVLDGRFRTPGRKLVQGCDDIGVQLRMRRKELKLTQAVVAECLGMSKRLIGEIEHGKEGVAVAKVLALANFLGIDLVLQVRGRE